jgi:hypothetical protein
VVRVIVLEAVRMVGLVRLVMVLRVVVVIEWFCRFLFVCFFCMHRYPSSLILGLRFLRATNETLLLFLFISYAVRFD